LTRPHRGRRRKATPLHGRIPRLVYCRKTLLHLSGRFGRIIGWANCRPRKSVSWAASSPVPIGRVRSAYIASMHRRRRMER
jgi:hypothetical protein